MPRLRVRQGSSAAGDTAAAFAEVREAIDQEDLRAVLLSCGPDHDLSLLGREIARSWSCPVLACTTAGSVGARGYEAGGIAGLSLAGGPVVVQPHLLAPLARCHREALRVAEEVRGRLLWGPRSGRAFALLAVDGLALAEEDLVGALYEALGGIPVVGGSAGDGFRFRRSGVYWDGAFHRDAAVLAVVETTLPFRTFRHHDVAPTGTRLVVTACDPVTRRVRELDGWPAAARYAELTGVREAELDLAHFARFPLLLRVGNEHHVRAIRSAEPDGGLTFLCGLSEGLVLAVGASRQPVERLRAALGAVTGGLPGAGAERPPVVLGFDGLYRRLALERAGVLGAAGDLLAAQGAFALTMHGEQHDGLHLNQTLTGVALGT